MPLIGRNLNISILALSLLMLDITSVVAKTPREIFVDAAQSVVAIIAEISSNKTMQGSGVIIDQQLIATNCHVVENSERITVIQQKAYYSAKIVGADRSRDVCLLQVSEQFGQPATVLFVDQVEIGSRAYAIGAPLGYSQTISEGIISGLRGDSRNVMIQTTAPISHGSSGGGLFNEDGRLIGITTSGFENAQNLNFAVPGDWIVEVWLQFEVAKKRDMEEHEAKRSRLVDRWQKQTIATKRNESVQRGTNENERDSEKIRKEKVSEENPPLADKKNVAREPQRSNWNDPKLTADESTRLQDVAKVIPPELTRREKIKQEYITKIKAKIERNTWAPEGLSGNPRAEFKITLLPTGEVLAAELTNSSGNPAFDEAVERSIFKSQPLPLPRPETTLFSEFRVLRLPFTYVSR